MELINGNILNLTSLWTTVGKQVGAFSEDQVFSKVSTHKGQWPNKLWTLQALDRATISQAKSIMQASPVKLSIPYWDHSGSEGLQLLEKEGFVLSSEQIGMSLKLDKAYALTEGFTIEKVTDERSAYLWSSLFKQAFSYEIHHALLLPAYDKTEFLIAGYQEEYIGTGILHYTENQIAGIHSMGVLRNQRRKGFAENMMKEMLNKALRTGCEYSTLQASPMGKGLYLKLGFREQFTQYNFEIAKQ